MAINRRVHPTSPTTTLRELSSELILLFNTIWLNSSFQKGNNLTKDVIETIDIAYGANPPMNMRLTSTELTRLKQIVGTKTDELIRAAGVGNVRKMHLFYRISTFPISALPPPYLEEVLEHSVRQRSVRQSDTPAYSPAQQSYPPVIPSARQNYPPAYTPFPQPLFGPRTNRTYGAPY